MNTKYFDDAYDVLGVSRRWAAFKGHASTPDQDMLDRYYKICKNEEYDPSDPKEAERHARLDEAYQILSNRETRAAEDAWIEAKFEAKRKRVAKEKRKANRKHSRQEFLGNLLGKLIVGAAFWVPSLLAGAIAVCLVLMMYDAFPLINTSDMQNTYRLFFIIPAFLLSWAGKIFSGMGFNAAPIMCAVAKAANTIICWAATLTLVLFIAYLIFC